MMNKERVIYHFSRILGMPVTQYSMTGKLVSGFYEMSDDFCLENYLSDEALAQLFSQSRADGLSIYRAESGIRFFMIGPDRGAHYLFGPFQLLDDTGTEQGIATMTYTVYVNTICMCYELITGKKITPDELINWKLYDISCQMDLKTKVSRTIFAEREEKLRHHDYNWEIMACESITKGDAEKFKRLMEGAAWNDFPKLARTSLRSYRNRGISMITIIARAAIEGGVGSEQAFSLSDAYIIQIEEETDIDKIYMIGRQAGIDFANRVAQCHNTNQHHLLVERCENLIFSRLHGKIIVKELADNLSVNPDYLSRLFHEQLGITITEYIHREKIKLAQNMLIYSLYSLEEISYYLGFSTQSHFGRVFKKQTGMTPGQYRQRYAVEDFFN